MGEWEGRIGGVGRVGGKGGDIRITNLGDSFKIGNAFCPTSLNHSNSENSKFYFKNNLLLIL